MGKSFIEVTNRTVNVIASTIVKRGDSFLMIQEKREEVYGLWNFLSGKAELGETILEAAMRECKEESGVDVRVTDVAEIAFEQWKGGTGISIRFVFWGEVIEGGEETLNTDALSVAWKTEEELRELIAAGQLRNPYTYRLADLALAGRRLPLDLVYVYESDIDYTK